ncbi:F-box protein CPR30-like [Arachis ipaensis]|uniref:F-box protein CPR30-like n=1 Tax=Arachis ipaensis TaxID=130454 RepID=UPI000A2B6A50|nr:F-box protein CPR30-like [Arachis ipaensis]XP_025650150.1 F-box protein CPR1-like [Arachis hypogaea]QHO09433.1 F-box protein [Arachis hypogaea]
MEQSSMEKKLQSINDLLPLELIEEIFLRIPIKHLARLRFVSKLWNTLISDPHFAKSHLDHSLAPSHTCLFLQDKSQAYSVDLDALLHDNTRAISPIYKKAPPVYHLLGSCRGFVLLHGKPQFLIQWNPLTGSSKTISYSHIDNTATSNGEFFALLYGFGYDASQDDYVVVVAYKGKDGKNHFDLCCLGSNSWINLDAELPKSLNLSKLKPYGVFCNGAIHWSTYGVLDAILVFDLKERNFSKIEAIKRDMFRPGIVQLGGCLALYLYSYVEDKTEIWVMKEYKVQSSWTLLCVIPLNFFKALCLSANGDIIGRCRPSNNEIVFYIYNVSGVLLKYVWYRYSVLPNRIQFVVHANSLMAVSSSIKDKKMKKGCQNQKEVKQGNGNRGKQENNLDT